MLLGKIANAVNRQRTRRLGMAFFCALLLAACTDTGPEEEGPLPAVTTQEFEQRLTLHLSRFVTEVLESDAHASKPKTSRTAGCADLPDGGPTWGVVPQAEITVSAGEKGRKYLDDMQYWMFRNEFQEDGAAGDSVTSMGPNDFTGVHKDGTQVHMDWLDGGPESFTITLAGPCTWPSDRPGGPPSGRLPSLPPPSGPQSVTVDVDACRSPKINIYDDEARPFAGRGPHPMALVDYSDEEDVEYDTFFLPDGWEPDDILHSGNPGRKKVQLLVCVRMEAGAGATGRTGGKVTCSYTTTLWGTGGGVPHTFDLLESVYHVEVREALTGKKVAEFDIPGTQGGKKNCPYDSELSKNLALGVDEAALQRKLRPLFQSPR